MNYSVKQYFKYFFLGVTVDYPTKNVYWVDTYLDYVEKVDYDGKNRKTVARGIHVRNAYGVSVFQNRYHPKNRPNTSNFAMINLFFQSICFVLVQQQHIGIQQVRERR